MRGSRWRKKLKGKGRKERRVLQKKWRRNGGRKEERKRETEGIERADQEELSEAK